MKRTSLFSVVFLLLSISLHAQNDTAQNEIHGGLFMGYSGINKSFGLSFQGFYEREIIPYIGVGVVQGAYNTWEDIPVTDTTDFQVGTNYYKTGLFVFGSLKSENNKHHLKVGMGPAIYYGYNTKITDTENILEEVIVRERLDKDIDAGIQGTINYSFFTKRKIAIGVFNIWEVVFGKGTYGNFMTGIVIGGRFQKEREMIPNDETISPR